MVRRRVVHRHVVRKRVFPCAFKQCSGLVFRHPLGLWVHFAVDHVIDALRQYLSSALVTQSRCRNWLMRELVPQFYRASWTDVRRDTCAQSGRTTTLSAHASRTLSRRLTPVNPHPCLLSCLLRAQQCAPAMLHTREGSLLSLYISPSRLGS